MPNNEKKEKLFMYIIIIPAIISLIYISIVTILLSINKINIIQHSNSIILSFPIIIVISVILGYSVAFFKEGNTYFVRN
jgi:hypothetical protein